MNPTVERRHSRLMPESMTEYPNLCEAVAPLAEYHTGKRRVYPPRAHSTCAPRPFARSEITPIAVPAVGVIVQLGTIGDTPHV